jgi:hypothetical protein
LYYYSYAFLEVFLRLLRANWVLNPITRTVNARTCKIHNSGGTSSVPLAAPIAMIVEVDAKGTMNGDTPRLKRRVKSDRPTISSMILFAHSAPFTQLMSPPSAPPIKDATKNDTVTNTVRSRSMIMRYAGVLFLDGFILPSYQRTNRCAIATKREKDHPVRMVFL